MEINVKPQMIEISMVLTPNELKFLKEDFDNFREDDEDECDCREDDCYSCSNGSEVLTRLHKTVDTEYEKTRPSLATPKSSAKRKRS